MTMTEQTENTMTLSALAEQAVASIEWWKEGALEKPNALELPTRVMVALENAGIHTVEQLKAAGPHRLRELEGVGKGGFEQIIELLRELDRQNGGASHDQQGKIALR
jgi:DNA-directed RNA polymerase alpha subunit